MNTNELAYIAGLFDGEGCVTCKQKATKRKDRNNKIYKTKILVYRKLNNPLLTRT